MGLKDNRTEIGALYFLEKQKERVLQNSYGVKRVLEPEHVLSTSAWKVDNSREINDDEMRVAIRTLHIESTSFKQISIESNQNAEKIKDRIMDIVIKRGKMHNPVTDTGGVLFGVVEEIGENYNNKKNLKVGDEVICNASLAAIPIYISRITRIDRTYTEIDAEGYGILFNDFPIVKKPENIPMNLLLFAFDESGTLYTANSCAKGKESILIVGNNMMTNALFGYAVRKSAGPNAKIVCLFDRKSNIMVKGKSMDILLSQIFNEIHFVNILKPVDCLQRLNVEGLFDLTVNCADIPGAETINILATKSGGTVLFANLINNYNIALYITESISRQLELRCADGYVAAYDKFDIEMVRELAPYFQAATVIDTKLEDDVDYHLGRTKKSLEQSGYRKSLIDDFICESRPMMAVLDEVLSVAKYDCNVLITGDTGVGKEKVASLIQKNSIRNMQTFIKVNCAAIADNLIESEFFGYEQGAFTGAKISGKKGYFEMADNGTIFLDEVGELPLEMQAKLLRVLQDGEFYKVGGVTPVKTNLRIISATNKDLEEMMELKLFRRDLYYRLNVFPIRVPNLNERKMEIPVLVRHFVEKYNEKFKMEKFVGEDVTSYLSQCSWPGNIRELENVVQRLMIASKSEEISNLDVMKEMHRDLFDKGEDNWDEEEAKEQDSMDLNVLMDGFEKNILKVACEKYGSTRKTAKAIGISQTQLIRKKNKYSI